MKVYKVGSVPDVRLLFLRDWPYKSQSTKLGNAVCGTTATRDDWSADKTSFMYFGQSAKLWYSW